MRALNDEKIRQNETMIKVLNFGLAAVDGRAFWAGMDLAEAETLGIGTGAFFRRKNCWADTLEDAVKSAFRPLPI